MSEYSLLKDRAQSSTSKYRGPDLSNTSRYVRIESVPIIDVLKRSYFKKDDNGNPIEVEESLDKDQLKVLLKNSKDRAEKGEYGLVFVGHTTDSGRETDQPPIVGYISNHKLGEHNGNPTILADLYLDREECDPSKTIRQFPRRSAEVIGLEKPDGYVDAVSLLKRTPERDLGLLTSHYKSSKDVCKVGCPQSEGVSRMSRISQDSQEIIKSIVNEVIQHTKGSDRDMQKTRYKKHRDPSEPSDASEPSESSYGEPSSHRKSEPSGEADTSDSSEPSVDRYAKHERDEDHDISALPDPSRMDPRREPRIKKGRDLDKDFIRENKKSKMAADVEEGDDEGFDEETEDHESDASDSSDPSRMCRMEDKGRKKAKLAAGGGAGFPGPGDSYVPSMSEKKFKSAKSTIKTKTKLSRNPEEDRMREESENVKRSRFQKDLDAIRAENARLMERLNQADSEKRQAKIERQIAQLEYEGYDLDRADEVTRFMKLSEDQIPMEIDRIRKRYSKSPVNQPVIPSFSGDYGGSSLPPPARQVNLLAPLPEEYQQPGMPIIGSQYARFRADNEEEFTEPPPKNPMAARSRGNLKMAIKVVQRYNSEREKSRT